jgi:hypothetical protein
MLVMLPTIQPQPFVFSSAVSKQELKYYYNFALGSIWVRNWVSEITREEKARRVFRLKRDGVTRGWRNCLMRCFITYALPQVYRMGKENGMGRSCTMNGEEEREEE